MLHPILHRRMAGALFLLFILPLTALAQSNTSFAGQLLDQNSAAIPGAAVTLRQANSTYEQTVTTDAQGRFRFDSLLSGDYYVRIRRAGFGLLESDVHLPSDKPEVVYVMEPDSIAESVVVTSSHLLTSSETS